MRSGDLKLTAKPFSRLFLLGIATSLFTISPIVNYSASFADNNLSSTSVTQNNSMDSQGDPNPTGISGDEGSDPNQHLDLQGNQDDGQPFQNSKGQARDNTRRPPQINDHDDGINIWSISTALLALVLAGLIAYLIGHRNGRKSKESSSKIEE
jgi:hypothetical protein